MKSNLKITYNVKRNQICIKDEVDTPTSNILIFSLTDLDLLSYLINKNILKDIIRNNIKEKNISISNLRKGIFANLIQDNKESVKTGLKRVKIDNEDRTAIWMNYHGKSIEGECYTCGIGISPFSCKIAHVKAHSKGGGLEMDNLRTCCYTCDSLMGNQNLYAFIVEEELKGSGAANIEAYFNKFPDEKKDTKIYHGKVVLSSGTTSVKDITSIREEVKTILNSDKTIFSHFIVLQSGNMIEKIHIGKNKNILKLWSPQGHFIRHIYFDSKYKIICLPNGNLAGNYEDSKTVILDNLRGEAYYLECESNYIVPNSIINLVEIIGYISDKKLIISYDNRIALWNINTKQFSPFPLCKGRQVKLCVLLKGSFFIVAFHNNIVELYNTRLMTIRISKNIKSIINCIVQIKQLVIIGTSNSILSWNLDTDIFSDIAKGCYAEKNGIAVLNDYKIGCQYWDGRIMVWDVKTNTKLYTTKETLFVWQVVGSLQNKIVLSTLQVVKMLDYLTNSVEVIFTDKLDITNVTITNNKIYIATKEAVHII